MVTNTPKAAKLHPESERQRSGLDGYFEITKRHSTLSREIRGGLVTFFAMAYIIALNPLIIGTAVDRDGNLISGQPKFSDAAMTVVNDAAVGQSIGMVAAATALVAGLLTLAMGVIGRFPMGLAAGLGLNALVAYVTYMVQTVWPLNLSVHYPYPESVSLWKTVPAVFILAGISVAALVNFKRRPWIFVGWFFFIGNLVMVSGVIQGGLWPAHADRFMYVPGIGLFILIAWLGAEKLKGSAAWGAAIVFCLFLAGLSPVRVADWKDSVTLYRKALDVNSADMVSTVNLAFALDRAGQSGEALPYYEKIVERYPAYAEVHANMAVILAEQGQAERAGHHFDQAVERAPKSVTAWFNKGLFHQRLQETDRAGACFEKVLELKPDHPEALQNLATMHIMDRHYDKAEVLYKKALGHLPGAGLSIRYNLACVYAMSRKNDKALETLRGLVADGFDRIDLLMHDEQLENVRGTKEFRGLLEDLESRKP